MSDSRSELVLKLKEIFRSDQSDLDFGIYKILNHRRDEIHNFIETELVQKAEDEFEDLMKRSSESLMEELEILRTEINRDFGDGTISPNGEIVRNNDAPKIIQYLKMKSELEDTSRIQSEIYDVFNHVYEFFNRYYDKGDFISQRRFGGREKYVLPSNGEEVSLLWANDDQYYVKTAEDYNNYSFELGKYRLQFKVIKSDESQNTNLNEDLFFIINREIPSRFFVENNVALIYFEHKVLHDDDYKYYQIEKQSQKNTKFKQIIETNLQTIIEDLISIDSFFGGDDEQRVIEKHLRTFSQKNEMDYFIHKNLGVFLKRELDFYLKNEVIDLSEWLPNDAVNDDVLKRKVNTIKKLSDKIIDYLHTLEKYQKQLFEKPKFVYNTNYILTLDQIEEKHYETIITNESQINEWESLFGFDISTESLKLKNRMDHYEAKEEKTIIDILKLNPHLPIDTVHFDPHFKYEILNDYDDLDAIVNGLIIKSENFQALNIIKSKYKNKIRCCYIDPPYNTDATPILYKNNYKHSSWLSLIRDRINLTKKMLIENEGVLSVAIDDTELANLTKIIEQTYFDYDVQKAIVIHYPGSGTGRSNISRTHEYNIYAIPKNQDILRGNLRAGGMRERNFRRSGTGENNYRVGRPNSFFAIVVDTEDLQIKRIEKPPSGDYPTDNTSDGFLRIYPIGEDDSERVWSLSYEGAVKALANGSLKCTKKHTILRLYDDDEKRNLLDSVWSNKKFNATSHGTNLLTNIFGTSGLFSYPKSLYTVMTAIDSICWPDPNSIVLDYFAGSGTTGHAVMQLNKADSGNRKYILIEMDAQFDYVIKPRIKKILFSDQWKKGKPMHTEGYSNQIVKYFSLEQYEDALSNITFSTTDGYAQTTLHTTSGDFLNYILYNQNLDSSILLNITDFKKPFQYKIITNQNHQEQESIVDLVETFNYLLGLNVRKTRYFNFDSIPYVAVYGQTSSSLENVLIIWRDFDETNLESEKKFIEESIIPKLHIDESKPLIIYINVDSYVEGAQSIEPTFNDLMGVKK